MPFLISISKKRPASAPAVALETMTLAIHAGKVTLVPALTYTEPYEVPMDEIEYNAPTLVSRERFAETIDFPMYDGRHSINLRAPLPDLKRMNYASIEEMVSDAWVSPTTVELKLPVAISKSQKMLAEGRSLVTRERTAESMAKPPLPSRYSKYEESIPHGSRSSPKRLSE